MNQFGWLVTQQEQDASRLEVTSWGGFETEGHGGWCSFMGCRVADPSFVDSIPGGM